MTTQTLPPRAEPLLYAGFAIFAAVTAAVTHLGPHRVWGLFAAVAYGLAAVFWRTRTAAWLALGGAVVLPLAVLVLSGQGQPEVAVVQRSGAHLLAYGTPYLSPGELAGGTYESYNPYLPGMALLGLPSALAGIDARLVFGGVFLMLLGRRNGRLLAASPLVALPLVVGGDDLPVIGLVCAGFTLAARDRPALAGLAMGFAATLKATAWPAALVCLALIATRGGAARRYGAVVAGLITVGVGLPALVDPSGMFENVVAFPLGLAGVESPADSPLPGHLLAASGAYGHAAAVAALGVAALGMGVSLVVRPPGDVRAAALRLAAGLLLATALMPATRWGYLVYPAVLVCWARLTERRKEPELCLAA
ncbi:glycosyltransferase 87 family protein [Actinomadura fulvescens]